MSWSSAWRRCAPKTPVLYMSGHTDSETVHLKASGATIHLLQKPFTAGGLARKVRELLDLPVNR